MSWGFWLIIGLVLGIALILMPMAFRPDPPPRRPSISRPIPRTPATPRRAVPAAPPGPVPVAARSVPVVHALV
jgi:hypothetical protein